MKIQTRIFLGVLFIVGVAFYFLISWIVGDLEPQYRKTTEEQLVDTARLMATVASTTLDDGQIDTELFSAVFQDFSKQTFYAEIYDFLKTSSDVRVYITDRNGIVLFDSDGGRDEGKDYSEWRDVLLTLGGEYGARTSRDLPNNPGSSVMYVAAPIYHDRHIVGVLTVGKPTQTANEFVARSERRIIVGGTVTLFSIILVGFFLSRMVTRPIERLTGYARKVRDGMRTTLPNLGKGEIRELGDAFEEMRDALEGKQYVENYVQTLTHEIKSPLSAIRGAIELLHEDMPAAEREVFLRNIRVESQRIQTIVEKMLLLSSLESRKILEDRQQVNLTELLEEVVESLRPAIEERHLTLRSAAQKGIEINGDPFLLRQAVGNLLKNAIEFSPDGGQIDLVLKGDGSCVELTVTDQGPGIPDYALSRVFERFYSLKRPDTGKKSSGLGMSIVREVAELHKGTASIRNGESGAAATLTIPMT